MSKNVAYYIVLFIHSEIYLLNVFYMLQCYCSVGKSVQGAHSLEMVKSKQLQ